LLATYVAEPLYAKAVCAGRRITNRELAAAYGSSASWMGRVLNGRDRPSPRFREWLSEYLGLPAEELFAPAADRLTGPS
jgi:transcriptional regulator with XRE-family HTH domain